MIVAAVWGYRLTNLLSSEQFKQLTQKWHKNRWLLGVPSKDTEDGLPRSQRIPNIPTRSCQLPEVGYGATSTNEALWLQLSSCHKTTIFSSWVNRNPLKAVDTKFLNVSYLYVRAYVTTVFICFPSTFPSFHRQNHLHLRSSKLYAHPASWKQSNSCLVLHRVV